MNKLLAVAVAASFAFSAAGFAQTPAKQQEELTKEERAEMRNRAEKLRAERAVQPAPRTERTTQPAAQGKAATVHNATAKPADLTAEERVDLRNRAEKLKAERARTVTR